MRPTPGVRLPLEFKQSDAALVIDFPPHSPTRHASAFRISFGVTDPGSRSASAASAIDREKFTLALPSPIYRTSPVLMGAVLIDIRICSDTYEYGKLIALVKAC
jgi:hypothetical protein